jgi:kynurenine/2-aminoadipate aminotransferase
LVRLGKIVFNVLLEDDPYYYLQLPTKSNPEVKPVASFMSMDVDGRVIRLDSFSKIISSGLRMGFVTGPKAIVEQLQIDQQATCLHASGLSQMLLYKLLTRWGKEGWKAQVKAVEKTYTERRDMLLKYADQYLTGLAKWHAPSAGKSISFGYSFLKECSFGFNY